MTSAAKTTPANQGSAGGLPSAEAGDHLQGRRSLRTRENQPKTSLLTHSGPKIKPFSPEFCKWVSVSEIDFCKRRINSLQARGSL